MLQDMANYIKKLTDENKKLKEENEELKEINKRQKEGYIYWRRKYYDELKGKCTRLKVDIKKLIEEEDNVL